MKKFISFIILTISFISCAKNENLDTQTISSNENQKLSKIEENQTKKEKIYVDVRTKEEWNEGHVAWAIHISLDDIKAGKYDEIPKDKEVHIYCRSGNRSEQAIKFLEEKWYKNLINAGWLRDLKDIEIEK